MIRTLISLRDIDMLDVNAIEYAGGERLPPELAIKLGNIQYCAAPFLQAKILTNLERAYFDMKGIVHELTRA